MMQTEHRAVVVAATDRSESIVVRWPAGIVVLDGSREDVASALAVLRPDGEAEPASGLLIERLRMLRIADMAAGVSTPAGLRLIATGRGVAQAATNDVFAREGESAASASPTGRREVDVDGGTSRIWIGLGEIDETIVESSARRTMLDLASGVVPGRGVLLARPSSAPMDPRQSDRGFEVVDFGTDEQVERRTPLPIQSADVGVDSEAAAEARTGASDLVLGIRCSREHFNNPSAAYCQVCGISMVHITHHLVSDERPTLGFLVFDDGATFALDRSYVVGREPSVSPDSSLAPLVADDNEHTVSRNHAELVLDGWELVVHDLGSTNGTFVWRAERREWERVLPNRPVVVVPGASVALGQKTFVYEPVARSV